MLTAKAITKAGPSAGGSIDFSGTWTNQLNSTMVLSQNGQALSGQYRSPVSGGGGAIDGALTGWVDGDLITFNVNWNGPASLTSWAGQLVDEAGRPTIKTLWHLV
jgi:hypothetical protein